MLGLVKNLSGRDRIKLDCTMIRFFIWIFALLEFAMAGLLGLLGLVVFIGTGDTSGYLIASLFGLVAFLIALLGKQNLRKLKRPRNRCESDEHTVVPHEAMAGSFLREADLEKYVVDNWDQLDLGIPMEFVAQQVQCDEFGVIDILARDKQTRDYVVIELKKTQADDVVFGQISRYMGGIQRNRAKIERVKVRGVIIAQSISPKLRAAASVNPNVELRQYIWIRKGETRENLAIRMKCSPRELLLLGESSDLRSKPPRKATHFRAWMRRCMNGQ